MIKFIVGEPALLVEHNDERIMIVADQHLGFEYELAEMGISIPSQMPKIRERLIKLLNENRVDRLIFLGDVKHSVPKIALQEWQIVPEFFESILKVVSEVAVIPGNHDANLELLLPSSVKILSRKGIILEGDETIALFHGHTWPHLELFQTECMVVGHSHPVIHLNDPTGLVIVKQVWAQFSFHEKSAEIISRHYKVEEYTLSQWINSKKPKLILMPSFNDVLGGLAINIEKTPLGPIFRSGIIDVENADIYLLDGTLVGRLKDLRKYAVRGLINHMML